MFSDMEVLGPVGAGVGFAFGALMSEVKGERFEQSTGNRTDYVSPKATGITRYGSVCPYVFWAPTQGEEVAHGSGLRILFGAELLSVADQAISGFMGVVEEDAYKLKGFHYNVPRMTFWLACEITL